MRAVAFAIAGVISEFHGGGGLEAVYGGRGMEEGRDRRRQNAGGVCCQMATVSIGGKLA
jgi:hypothetical protein